MSRNSDVPAHVDNAIISGADIQPGGSGLGFYACSVKVARRRTVYAVLAPSILSATGHIARQPLVFLITHISLIQTVRNQKLQPIGNFNMTTESTLPARYQIRKLTPADLDWAKAIITHSNLYNSPVWSVIYPESKGDAAQRAYNMFKTLDYHHLHAISSGHSYGVFDTEYVFKRPESAATGGKLYWDFDNLSATGADLLDQMDFPLVHVALGYDAFEPMDFSRLAEFISYLPELGILFKTIEEQDPRDPEAKKPKALGQAIIRAGTCTRGDYEGKGLTKGVAHWYMKEKAKEGFKSIQIDSAARAVDTVWGNPPAPFKAEVTNSFETMNLEVEEEGVKKKPFVPADVWCARTVVTLRSD